MDARLWIEQHEKQMIEDICTLVRIPSVSMPCQDAEAPFGRECRDALEASLALGARMGFETENHENYCGSLLWRGELAGEIGCFGHTDVVPAGGGWSYPPFEPTVTDGMIIGRGASDNKGSFMAMLYALWYLKENGWRPRHSIRFLLGCNEEKGMEDAEYYALHYPEPEFTLVPDVMFPVCNGEKGILTLDAACRRESSVLLEFSSGIMSNAVPDHAEAILKLDSDGVERLKGMNVCLEAKGEFWQVTAEGISAHAAFPEGSDNAEEKLARCLLDAEVLDEDGKELMNAVCAFFGDYYGAGLGIDFEDEISGKLTHVGGIARYHDGVFSQNINIRYNVTADYDRMISNIRQRMRRYGFELVKIDNSAPCYTDADHPLVTRLMEICREEFGTDQKPYVMGGGTYARKLAHAVGFGPGIPGKEKRFGTARGGAHQADEYVEIAHLKQAFQIYVKAIPAIDEVL